MEKYKLAILTSHPIQYQTPLFQNLGNHPAIDLMVYYCWDFGAKKETYDAEFGRKIRWDIPLMEGYKCKFLKNYSLKPFSDFWGQVNFGIISELRKSDYGAVIVFGWNSFTNWLAFFTAFFKKTPVFLRGDNPFNQELLKPKWKIKIKKIILGGLFKRISAFLYVGEENKKFYKYYGVPEEKLFFCPHAIDNGRFAAASKILSAKRDKNDIIVLFVGKLIEKKRPMDLLKAYEKSIFNFQFSIFNTTLLFVGDGILRPQLEKYAKDNNIQDVKFIGFKNQTELPQYYGSADIFVLPSGLGETWGLVVNEAMCFKLPVIISDVVGCDSDLVKHGENGYIFPTGDVEKLAEGLKNLIENPEKRKKFGEKSFEIIQNYTFEKDIVGILKAIKK